MLRFMSVGCAHAETITSWLHCRNQDLQMLSDPKLMPKYRTVTEAAMQGYAKGIGEDAEVGNLSIWKLYNALVRRHLEKYSFATPYSEFRDYRFGDSSTVWIIPMVLLHPFIYPPLVKSKFVHRGGLTSIE